MKIKFHNNQIEIKDDASFQRKIMLFLVCLNLFNLFIQIWSRWNEFSNLLLYLFIVFFVLMIATLVYYLFYNSSQEIIEHEQIQYFKIKNILGLKLRYFKLTDDKTRLLYLKGKSTEIKELINYLEQNSFVIMS
ncbi:MAG: hypothetical protein GVY05_09235 [Bacteroidetes bacterium]|jgi:Ca2+/Na+ antiporter|nr:hypothetical protein [Bacteroidota bacterium]